MPAHDHPDDDNSALNDASLGTMMRQAREQQGLSQEDLATELHLDLRQITQLEEDDYSALPAPAFVKGYIRACAKRLNADGDLWVERYVSSTRDPDPKLATLSSFKRTDSSHPLFRWATIAILMILVALAVYWWLTEKGQRGGLPAEEQAVNEHVIESSPPSEEGSLSQKPTNTRSTQETQETSGHVTPDPTSTSEQNASLESGSEGSEPVSRESDAPKLSTSQNDNPQAVASTAAPETDQQPSQASSEKTEQREAPPQETSTSVLKETSNSPADTAEANLTTEELQEEVETLTPVEPAHEVTGEDILYLMTESKSWVEVYDDDGHRLMFDMLTHDSPRQLQGRAPFRVFLGDATGVTITINNIETSEISYHEATKTARFYVDANGAIRK
ncbi:MAG: DUF4115 domain-containing protein [Gammaproteobacteria bacterium]|nr:DUF4115 domain-containing protein [Gammaproteobacteria bacterium]